MLRLLPLLIACACLGCRSSAEAPGDAPTPTERPSFVSDDRATPPRFRGVTLDLRRQPAESPLPRLRSLGADAIALVPFAFQERLDDPGIRFNPEPGWYSEGATGARALAAAGDSLGLGVVLKPQVWIGGHDGGWSADIGFETEADWQAWEDGYRRYILHHARLAAEIESPLFVIGTELGRAARARPDFFRALADTVRTVYPGPLTYAANWYDDYEHVAFWDALDFVGVQAYFPLAAEGDTAIAVERLVAAWRPHVEAIQRVAERTGKPVVFTEVGYRSVHYAAAEPWRWPERDERTAPDDALQARLYEAFFQTFWNEPWFEGAFVWKWMGESRRPGRHALGFSFHDKPAETVLAAWYGR